MIRRYGTPPQPDRTYTHRPGAYAILAAGPDILLTHQLEPEPELQLPGGGIDPGETPTSALHREVMEETGWRIQVIRKLVTFRQFTYMPEYDLWAEKLCHIYLGAPVRRHGPPREAGHSAVWLPINEAPALIPSTGGRAALTRYLRHGH